MNKPGLQNGRPTNWLWFAFASRMISCTINITIVVFGIFEWLCFYQTIAFGNRSWFRSRRLLQQQRHILMYYIQYIRGARSNTPFGTFLVANHKVLFFSIAGGFPPCGTKYERG